MSDAFTVNEAASRFEWQEGADTAHARYRLKGKILYIEYVEAPPALRGTGAAGRLMGAIQHYAQGQHYDIVPICGYAAAWLNRHGTPSA